MSILCQNDLRERLSSRYHRTKCQACAGSHRSCVASECGSSSESVGGSECEGGENIASKPSSVYPPCSARARGRTAPSEADTSPSPPSFAMNGIPTVGDHHPNRVPESRGEGEIHREPDNSPTASRLSL